MEELENGEPVESCRRQWANDNLPRLRTEIPPLADNNARVSCMSWVAEADAPPSIAQSAAEAGARAAEEAGVAKQPSVMSAFAIGQRQVRHFGAPPPFRGMGHVLRTPKLIGS
jgi:hypothetical protein